MSSPWFFLLSAPVSMTAFVICCLFFQQPRSKPKPGTSLLGPPSPHQEAKRKASARKKKNHETYQTPCRVTAGCSACLLSRLVSRAAPQLLPPRRYRLGNCTEESNRPSAHTPGPYPRVAMRCGAVRPTLRPCRMARWKVGGGGKGATRGICRCAAAALPPPSSPQDHLPVAASQPTNGDPRNRGPTCLNRPTSSNPRPGRGKYRSQTDQTHVSRGKQLFCIGWGDAVTLWQQ